MKNKSMGEYHPRVPRQETLREPQEVGEMPDLVEDEKIRAIDEATKKSLTDAKEYVAFLEKSYHFFDHPVLREPDDEIAIRRVVETLQLFRTCYENALFIGSTTEEATRQLIFLSRYPEPSLSKMAFEIVDELFVSFLDLQSDPEQHANWVEQFRFFFEEKKVGNQLMETLICRGTDEQRKAGLAVLETSLSIAKSDNGVAYALALTYGSDTQAHLFIDNLHSALETKKGEEDPAPEVSELMLSTIANALLLNQEFTKSDRRPDDFLMEERLAEALKPYGVGHILFVDDSLAWVEGGGDPFESVTENARAAIMLEKKHPGSTTVLAQEFGVRTFARYPEELLAAQFEERNKNDKPYGVMISAENDHNGAFYTWKDQFAEMYHDLEGQYYLRALECGTVGDLMQLLVGLDQRYGQQNKISFIILNGHGHKNGFTFGADKKTGSRLHKQDLHHPVAQEVVKHLFVKEPTIVVNSCRTGSPGGLTQALSKLTGGKAFGARGESGVLQLSTLLENGKVDFKVPDNRRRNIGIYVNGEPLQL